MKDLRIWLRGLPKAELHVHLEGTLTPESYRRIANRNGISIVGDPAELYRCTDFQSFLSAFLQVVRVLKQPDDFYEIASDYLATAADQGVRHVEFMFSPATPRHFFPGIDLEQIVGAIFDGCEQARAKHGISSLLIFDMVRNLGEAAALTDVDLAWQCDGYGVVGVGLGGDEENFPARDFAGAFKTARARGLCCTVHAGEAAGASGIRDAIEVLEPDRIGHAVAAAGHRDVLELIRTQSIAVEACPTSNEVTRVWNPEKPHPIFEFLDAGISVTLNSDDPAFFGSSLLDEYSKVAAAGMDRRQLIQLARNSFIESFASQEQKRTWLRELDAYVNQNQARE